MRVRGRQCSKRWCLKNTQPHKFPFYLLHITKNDCLRFYFCLYPSDFFPFLLWLALTFFVVSLFVKAVVGGFVFDRFGVEHILFLQFLLLWCSVPECAHRWLPLHRLPDNRLRISVVGRLISTYWCKWTGDNDARMTRKPQTISTCSTQRSKKHEVLQIKSFRVTFFNTTNYSYCLPTSKKMLIWCLFLSVYVRKGWMKKWVIAIPKTQKFDRHTSVFEHKTKNTKFRWKGRWLEENWLTVNSILSGRRKWLKHRCRKGRSTWRESTSNRGQICWSDRAVWQGAGISPVRVLPSRSAIACQICFLSFCHPQNDVRCHPRDDFHCHPQDDCLPFDAFHLMTYKLKIFFDEFTPTPFISHMSPGKTKEILQMSQNGRFFPITAYKGRQCRSSCSTPQARQDHGHHCDWKKQCCWPWKKLYGCNKRLQTRDTLEWAELKKVQKENKNVFGSFSQKENGSCFSIQWSKRQFPIYWATPWLSLVFVSGSKLSAKTIHPRKPEGSHEYSTWQSLCLASCNGLQIYRNRDDAMSYALHK